MKLILICAILGVIASSAVHGFELSEEEISAQFEKFKRDFNRAYQTPQEESNRRTIFATNLGHITRHNGHSTPKSFRLGVNQFADMSNLEYREKILQLPRPLPGATKTRVPSLVNLPDEIDWVTQGKVVPVKNQGTLGTPIAFASVATVESAHAIATGQLVSMSEQQITDCCTDPAPITDDDVFKCIISMPGLDTENSYPDYKIWDQCKINPRTIAATIRAYVDIASGSEPTLQTAVANSGPVAVEIDASHISFQLYAGGVYDEPACSSTQADHAVAVVGYGSTNDNEGGVQFWKVKNSWGSAWGEEGYMRMSRNKQNQCGIASLASYPVV